MTGKEKKEKDFEGEQNCPGDPEDTLLDLNKMTPEEMRDYLDSLLRNRFFGC